VHDNLIWLAIQTQIHPDLIEVHMHRNIHVARLVLLCVTCSVMIGIAVIGCTQETQNRLGRAVQNWTGTDGILEIYAGDKLVKRFLQIDKLTTASATEDGGGSRPYRFGYGILDENLNAEPDAGEKKVYFEFSDYSTSYIFYENPR
jgi:hypothetical protein